MELSNSSVFALHIREHQTDPNFLRQENIESLLWFLCIGSTNLCKTISSQHIYNQKNLNGKDMHIATEHMPIFFAQINRGMQGMSYMFQLVP